MTVRSATDRILNAAAIAILPAYRMVARGRGEAEILLYGDIGDSWFGGVTARQFADDLAALGEVTTINLRINSAGGDVFDGLTIYHRLVEHKARVVAHIDGLAASIASIIAMAGDEIRIAESAQMMIHEAWGVAIGPSADLRAMAERLDVTTASLRDVYVARTGKSASQIASWMTEETWFSAAEAVENGFATTVAADLKMAARVDLTKHRFRNAPRTAIAPDNAEIKRRIAEMRARLARRSAG